MIPLVDVHCHLLAGLDDGPRTEADALAMCRIAYADGIRIAWATAHQNEQWSSVTPDRIMQACERLRCLLQDACIPLTIVPCAEVMARPGMDSSWRKGDLLSVANRGQYLLLEMPSGLYVDLRNTVRRLRQAGIRAILAHAERTPELLHESRLIEELIEAGCLVQVSSGSIVQPPSSRDRAALKGWFKRGIVHLLGSDAHSPSRRPPKIADAFRQIGRWAGTATADRICSTNGVAIAQGLPLRIAKPQLKRCQWIPAAW